MPTRLTAIAVAALLAITVAGCSDNPDTTTPAVPTTLAPGDEPDLTVRFIRLLHSGLPEHADAAIEMTTPGSPANTYARYFAAFNEAVTAAGFAEHLADQPVSPKDTGVQVCYPDATCVMLAQFDVNPDTGTADSFSVNGVPVNQIVAGSGNQVALGAGEARIIGAIANNISLDPAVVPGITVVVEVTEPDEKTPSFDITKATYRDANGAIAQPASVTTPSFGSNAGTTYLAVLRFDSTAPGGAVVIDVTDQTSPEPQAVELAVPAP